MYTSEFTPTKTTYIVLRFREECFFCDRGIEQIDSFAILDVCQRIIIPYSSKI